MAHDDIVKADENFLRDYSIVALRWFIEHIGDQEWNARRAKVVANFQHLKKSLTPAGARKSPPSDLNDYHQALYKEDTISWYMYLMENWEKRPECDEPFQSSRIGPFFSAIGYFIAELKLVKNLESKLDELLKSRRNNPDSIIFEMLVAICYVRNGFDVEFIPESPPQKTPDLLVTRDGATFFVECKRLDKTTGYAQQERIERNKRWAALRKAMIALGTSCHANIICHKPIEDVSPENLVALFEEQVSRGLIGTGLPSTSDEASLSVRYVDMQRVKKHFSKFRVRFGSPQLIELFAGEYDPFRDYTTSIMITELGEAGPESDEYAYNVFVGNVAGGFTAKWLNASEESMDKKAKDLKRHLHKAASQVSDETRSIIHIGYETLHGPEIEFVRHQKILESISTYDFGEKQVAAVFCHAMQTLASVEKFDAAETTIRFGRGPISPDQLLPTQLLLSPLEGQGDEDTHWRQDLESRTKP